VGVIAATLQDHIAETAHSAPREQTIAQQRQLIEHIHIIHRQWLRRGDNTGGGNTCEGVDLQTDINNCGSRGKQCTNTAACGKPACVAGQWTVEVDQQKVGTVCAQASGPCENDARCAANSTACPDNTFKGTSEVCRPAAGDCDIAATCTGDSAACPPNAFKGTDIVCWASAGPCDVAETCTGSSADCPQDVLALAGTVCRAATPGTCEGPALCTGNAATCPSNPPLAAGTVCRAATNVCELNATCTGSSTTCPPNPPKCTQQGMTFCCLDGTCRANVNSCCR